MEKLPTLKGLDLIHAWFDLPENEKHIPKDVWVALDETSTTIKELNKDLENSENAYYSIKGELDNAKARIKELEEEKADSTKKIVGLIEYGAGLQHDIKKLQARIKELEAANQQIRHKYAEVLKAIAAPIIEDALKEIR